MPEVSNSTEETNQSLPEIPEKFAPGELAPADGVRSIYGFSNEQLPTEYQNHFKHICQLIAERDMFARIEEVKRAAEQRFYWRSMFDMYFNEKNALWEMPNDTPWGTGDSGDIPLSYQINIYQSYGRSFISKVGIIPNVRFEAFGDNPNSLRVAAAADAMRRKIEAQNDVDVFSEKVARLFWTDGRVGFYSRWVCDGSRFGYEDQDHVEEVPEGIGEGGKAPEKKPRQPKGGEVITPYGVLELKLPINMRDQCDFPFIQLSYEIDLTSAKAMYPNISDTISGGEPGPGEYNFDRTTRIACTQGIRLLTQTGDTVHQLPTYQQTWIRPSMFAEIEVEEDRKFFEDNFPDGARVVFIGDSYAESRNESMDDHWSVAYPIQGDGQTTPSCGYLIMSIQDALNDMVSLRMETYMKSIRAMYGDKNVFDFQAYAKQKAGPGAHYPTKSIPEGRSLQDCVFVEPEMTLPEDAVQFFTELTTTLPQMLTGLAPAVLGESDPNNETKGGILALRDASLGQQGVAWKAFRKAYTRSIEQLVKIGAYYREAEAEDGKITVSMPKMEDTIVDLEDLKGNNFNCCPDSDQNYPNTFEDQQLQFKNLLIAAGSGVEQAKQILADRKNAIQFKKYLALPDLVVPGADSAEKQLDEIEQMITEVPIPLPALQQYKLMTILAQKTGQPVPPEPPLQQLYRPSVGIDIDIDKHDQEAEVAHDWLLSQAGLRVKKDDPQAYLNVKLHFLLHTDQVKQAQAQAMKTQVQAETAKEVIKQQAKANAEKPKTPSETINFKDLGPHGQQQVAAQAGIDITADVAPTA